MGHGFFHTAEVYFEGADAVIRYVYDCGSIARRADMEARDESISAWRGAQGQDRDVDLVFVSHMHIDHTNGLEQLLDGFTVGTFVLPLVRPIERIVAVARERYLERDLSDFSVDFATDPIEALASISPGAAIVFVSAGDPWPEAADLDILPAEFGAGPNREELSLDIGGRPWPPAPGTVGWIDDSEVIQASHSGSANPWIFSFHVAPAVYSQSHRFHEELRQRLGLSSHELHLKLRRPSGIRELLGRKEIIEAYRAISRDLNLTSLCVYSGPRAKPATVAVKEEMEPLPGALRKPTVLSETKEASERVSWIGTGDAKLDAYCRVTPFVEWCGPFMGWTRTLTLPHHASGASLRLDRVAPVMPPVAVAPGKGRKHPTQRILDEVHALGIASRTVGFDRAFVERFEVS